MLGCLDEPLEAHLDLGEAEGDYDVRAERPGLGKRRPSAFEVIAFERGKTAFHERSALVRDCVSRLSGGPLRNEAKRQDCGSEMVDEKYGRRAVHVILECRSRTPRSRLARASSTAVRPRLAHAARVGTEGHGSGERSL
jgi:hypothetical protein